MSWLECTTILYIWKLKKSTHSTNPHLTPTPKSFMIEKGYLNSSNIWFQIHIALCLKETMKQSI